MESTEQYIRKYGIAENADVIITLNPSKERYLLHKCLLSNYSQTFHNLFTDVQSNETMTKFEISNVPWTNFELFLNYVYGHRPELDSETKIETYLVIADYFESSPLIEFLESALINICKKETWLNNETMKIVFKLKQKDEKECLVNHIANDNDFRLIKVKKDPVRDTLMVDLSCFFCVILYLTILVL